MISSTYNDGSVLHEVIQEDDMNDLESRMDSAFEKAVRDQDVSHISVVKNCHRNQLCPCGSGAKFKKCCMSKVNQGPFQVVP